MLYLLERRWRELRTEGGYAGLLGSKVADKQTRAVSGSRLSSHVHSSPPNKSSPNPTIRLHALLAWMRSLTILDQDQNICDINFIRSQYDMGHGWE